MFSAAEIVDPKVVEVEDDATVLSTLSLACGVVRFGAEGGKIERSRESPVSSSQYGIFRISGGEGSAFTVEQIKWRPVTTTPALNFGCTPGRALGW